MGKTALALNMAEHVALTEKLPAVIFSMEMSGTQLVMRLIGSSGRIDQQRLRSGRLEDADWPRLTSAIGALTQAPILIDETGALTALELRSRARRAARSFGGRLGLIVIDYLQLMSSSGSENRATEISEISRSLKALAKELQVPVIALSQLNRSLEQRPNKRPVMSDLRESGAIEQDADVILFIYRDEVYNPDSADKGTAELIIGKQRNGPIGTVKLTFLGSNLRPQVGELDSCQRPKCLSQYRGRRRVSGILCARHIMTMRSMYAKQENDDCGPSPSGADAVHSEGTH